MIWQTAGEMPSHPISCVSILGHSAICFEQIVFTPEKAVSCQQLTHYLLFVDSPSQCIIGIIQVGKDYCLEAR